MTKRRIGSLSLDLDNLWTYMRIHGDSGWEQFPSYLDTVVPRFLEFFEERGLTSTVFVVGKDATIASNHEALRSIVAEGHEIGNHSFMHEPWLHRYTHEAVASEIARAHTAIRDVTGQSPIGFRGPGFSVTASVLESLIDTGYTYDTSTLPTFIGPLARRYYFRGTNLDEQQQREREALFGSFSDGRLANKPYRWSLRNGDIVELPVTTFPMVKVPFHFSYLLYLSSMSERASMAYFAAGLKACKALGVGPSLLLHPLDFLGGADAPELEFFPGMADTAATKVRRLGRLVDRLLDEFDIGTTARFAATIGKGDAKLRELRPHISER
ncbi:MAG: polysaccharide deacetylase family protein [Acidimicrobiia bacterium]